MSLTVHITHTIPTPVLDRYEPPYRIEQAGAGRITTMQAMNDENAAEGTVTVSYGSVATISPSFDRPWLTGETVMDVDLNNVSRAIRENFDKRPAPHVNEAQTIVLNYEGPFFRAPWLPPRPEDESQRMLMKLWLSDAGLSNDLDGPEARAAWMVAMSHFWRTAIRTAQDRSPGMRIGVFGFPIVNDPERAREDGAVWASAVADADILCPSCYRRHGQTVDEWMGLIEARIAGAVAAGKAAWGGDPIQAGSIVPYLAPWTHESAGGPRVPIDPDDLADAILKCRDLGIREVCVWDLGGQLADHPDKPDVVREVRSRHWMTVLPAVAEVAFIIEQGASQ